MKPAPPRPLLICLLLVACGPGSSVETGSPSAADAPTADSLSNTPDARDAGPDEESEPDASHDPDESPGDLAPIEDAHDDDADGSVLDLQDEPDRTPELESDQPSHSDLEDEGDRAEIRDDPDLPGDRSSDVPLLEQGQVCARSDDCRTGLCAPVLEGTANVCTSSCSSAASCGEPSEWECLLRAGEPLCAARCGPEGDCEFGTCVAGPLVGAPDSDLCAIPIGSQCGADDDCGAGRLCQHVVGHYEMFSVCRQSGEGVPTGAECEADAACTSGRCWLGRCAGACEDDGGCPAEMVCSASLEAVDHYTDDPGDDTLVARPLCRPFAGSRGACSTDDDCDGEELCGLDLRADSLFVRSCRSVDSATGGFGDECEGEGVRLVSSELCGSEMCFDSECTSPCSEPSDCGPAGDWQCLDIPVQIEPGLVSVPVATCVSGAVCLSDDQCDDGAFCELIQTDSGFGGRCRSSNQSTAGESCDSLAPLLRPLPCLENAHCGARVDWVCDTDLQLCTPPARQVCARGPDACGSDGVCGDLCLRADDCGGDELCIANTAGFVDSAETPLDPTDDVEVGAGVCQYMPGAQTGCTIDSACEEGQVCRASVITGAPVSAHCAIPPAGSVAALEPCGDLPEGPTQCANGLCSVRVGINFGVGVCLELCNDDLSCGESQCVPLDGGESDLQVCLSL